MKIKRGDKFILFSIDSIFWVIIGITITLVLTKIIVNELLNIKITNQKDLFLTLFIIYSSLTVWLKLMFSRSGIKIKRLIGRYSFKNDILKILFLGILITIFSAVMFKIYLKFISLFFPLVSKKIMNMVEQDSLGNDLLFFTINRIIIVFVVPIIEEIIFRGILLHKWAIKYGIKKAVVLSSVIFAIPHFNLLGGFVFSVFACLLYFKYRKLWIPIILHMTNNSINTLSLYLQKLNVDLSNILLLNFLPLVYTLLFFLLLFIFMAFYMYINWYNFDNKLPYYS